MAYAKDLAKPTCQICCRRATKEAFNRHNASYGYFCARCLVSFLALCNRDGA